MRQTLLVAGLVATLLAGCARDRAEPAADQPARPGFMARTWDTVRFWKRDASAPAKPVAQSAGVRLEMEISPATVDLDFTRQLEVTVKLVNRSGRSRRLAFPSSQRIEVLLKDQLGKVLVRWSEDQPVENTPSVLQLNPRERAQYTANISTRDMTAGSTYFLEASVPAYPDLRIEQTVAPQ